ncbi:MAG: helix-turn-helix domain-containing protein [Solirubrobacterales bacterium]|nr:helix-turn-helix domain-containing protein [Solirubrobacterales bacterium]
MRCAVAVGISRRRAISVTDHDGRSTVNRSSTRRVFSSTFGPAADELSPRSSVLRVVFTMWTLLRSAPSRPPAECYLGCSLREPLSHIMRSDENTNGSPPGSRTIKRALCLLDSFTVREPTWRTTNLAENCGLPIPTTHRILRMLERFEYVVRDPSGAYGLGPAAASLARSDLPFAELRAQALPALRAIHRATSERVSLRVLAESRDHSYEVCVVGRAGRDGRVRPRPSGSRIDPLHAGASSKALLAQLGNEDLARAIRRGLERVGPATITRPARLRRELAAIRRRGWAFSREETAAGTWAVAVPLAGPSPSSACAVAVSGPLARCDAERARSHISVLARGARWLSNGLEAELGESVMAPMSAEKVA